MTPLASNTARRIGIAMADNEFISRGVVRGVLRYVAENPTWRVVGGKSADLAADVFRRWPPDGIVTSFEPRPDDGVPTVVVIHPCPGAVRVAMDDAKAGLLAAQHFRERGFRHFAFVGYGGQWWSDAREAGFVAALRDLAQTAPESVPRFRSGAFKAGRWSSPSRGLGAWLNALPKPVAVFACNDGRGRETLDAALDAGLRVPEDVAVLGVDNDEVECEMAHAPLSSVVYPFLEVGYCAAKTLAQLMAGEAVPSGPLLIAPSGIKLRFSTDVLAVDDPVVALACRFLRDHAGAAIGVADIARHVGVARRTLELRCRRALGRSVHDELLHARLRLAKQLLTDTNLPLKEVASRAGFGGPSYLAKVFRRELRTTPGTLRRNVRPLPAASA